MSNVNCILGSTLTSDAYPLCASSNLFETFALAIRTPGYRNCSGGDIYSVQDFGDSFPRATSIIHSKARIGECLAYLIRSEAAGSITVRSIRAQVDMHCVPGSAAVCGASTHKLKRSVIPPKDIKEEKEAQALQERIGTPEKDGYQKFVAMNESFNKYATGGGFTTFSTAVGGVRQHGNF